MHHPCHTVTHALSAEKMQPITHIRQKIICLKAILPRQCGKTCRIEQIEGLGVTERIDSSIIVL